MIKLAYLASMKSIHTIRWINELVKRGYEIHLITMHNSSDEKIDKRIKVYRLPFSPIIGYFLNVLPLRKLLKQIQPDILHIHYASGYGMLGRLSRFRPYVLSVWGDDVYDVPYKHLIYRWIVVANLRAADWVCSTSNIMAEQVRKLYPELFNLSVTPFGVDINLFNSKSNCKENEYITIGTVKTLDTQYAIDTLIKAFAEVRLTLLKTAPEYVEKLRFLIVGGGPLRDELEDLVKELGLRNITKFTGYVLHSEVPFYLNHLDVYVALSRISESFGVAIIEASACEVPVVVSDAGGLPEVVIDGVTGIVVKREDIYVAANAILRLIKNPVLRQAMGKSGRKHVIEHYNWSNNVSQMEKVYTQVLEKKEYYSTANISSKKQRK